MAQNPDIAPEEASDVDAAAQRMLGQAKVEPVPEAITELAIKLNKALADERKRAAKAR